MVRSPHLGPEVRVFTVYPDTVQLEGKSAFEFQFVANCPKPGTLEEKLECLEYAGTERKGKQSFVTTCNKPRNPAATSG